GRGSHMHVICMQRWLAKARPPAGVVCHGLATIRDGRPWPGPLQGAAARRGSCPQGVATRGHGRLWPARKGLSPAASPAASRGGGTGRKGGRRLCRGSGNTMRVKEG
ncbi:hypothetical protein GW17_00061708, partial [Ensete ventricosum]